VKGVETIAQLISPVHSHFPALSLSCYPFRFLLTCVKILRPTEKLYYLDTGPSPSPSASPSSRGAPKQISSAGADWGKNGTHSDQGSASQNKEEREPICKYGSYVTRLVDKLLIVFEKVRLVARIAVQQP
jgi:hypothetical protein